MSVVSDEIMMKEPNFIYQAAELFLLVLQMLPFRRGRLLHLRSVCLVSWQPFGLTLTYQALSAVKWVHITLH
jgi:hypothetical protein